MKKAITIEVKTGKGELDTSAIARKTLAIYNPMPTDGDLLNTTVVFSGAGFVDWLNVNGLVYMNGTREKIKPFKWTHIDGHVSCATCGNKSESRIRSCYDFQPTLADLFEYMGKEISSAEFNALYADCYNERSSRGDKSDGKAGDAIEKAIRLVISPSSKFNKGFTHAPANKDDCKAYILAELAEQLFDEMGL